MDLSKSKSCATCGQPHGGPEGRGITSEKRTERSRIVAESMLRVCRYPKERGVN